MRRGVVRIIVSGLTLERGPLRLLVLVFLVASSIPCSVQIVVIITTRLEPLSFCCFLASSDDVQRCDQGSQDTE